jgi:hypothetical protein
VEGALRPYVVDHQVDRTVLDDVYDYATKSDKTKLAHVKEVGQVYLDSGAALMKLKVPPEVADDHLAFANAFANLGNATQDMAAIATDPLRGLLGIQEYQTAWDEMADTLKSFYAHMHEKVIGSFSQP